MAGQSWWMDIIRRLFASLDGMIYGFVQTLYQLFAYIARLSIFGTEQFDSFRERIYLVLGIVMLFKIAFSLISLLSNPDDLTDSKKGLTGIIQRIIISLILITFIPQIFIVTREIQKIIIDDNIIGHFFLGNLDDPVSPEEMQKSGNMIAFQVLSAFYYADSNLQLSPGKDCADNNKQVVMPDVDHDTGFFTTSRKIDVREQDQETCGTEPLDGPEGFYYVTHHLYDLDLYLSQYVNEQAGREGNGNGKGYYAMHYDWLISTIAGIVVAWMFFGYCIDAAIRAVKLGALELIAPIPIFSYIDPKKGQEIFNNWMKTTISTYLSLFGRLVLIYFVLYVCHVIMSDGFSIASADGTLHPLTDNSTMSNIARVFIYIGLLLFAKDAPKLFGDMFGIKMEGSFGMKLAKMGMAGTALATGLAATKIGGGTWRRHLEKDQLRQEKKKIYDEADGPLTKEQKDKVNEINRKLNRSYGAQQIGRGAWVGLSRGALAGKDGKVNLSTYRQARSTANTTQKRRENGVSFIKEQQEKFHENIGMGGKYGQFGEWSDKAKELRNQISEGEKQEKAYYERYINDQMNVMQKMNLTSKDMKSYDHAIKSGDRQEILAIQGELTSKFNEYYSGLNDLEKKELGSAKSILGQMTALEATYDFAKKTSADNQALKKDLGKLEDNLKKNESK